MKTLLLVFFLLPCAAVFAQDQEPVVSNRRNTIKADLTSYWLFRQAVVVSYERTINNKRSWGIMAGYQRLPFTGSFGNRIGVTSDNRASGFKAGGEYRFYLAKENKFAAPHGLYLGPYFSFNNFSNEQAIEVDNNGVVEPVTLTSNISVSNLGVQLGYQFVFNDRWTIDISFMGPSFSYYNAQFDLAGNYTFNRDDVTNEIIDNLLNRFPGLNDLISSGTLSKQGKVDTWAYGYRYQIQVGYRFGGKK